MLYIKIINAQKAINQYIYGNNLVDKTDFIFMKKKKMP